MRYKTFYIGLAAMLGASSASAAALAAPSVTSLRQCTSTEVDDAARVTLGKSSVVPLPYSVVRMAIGGGQAGGRTTSPVQVASDAGVPAVQAKWQVPAAPSAAPNNHDGVSEVSMALLAPNELFVLGRRAGGMNVVLQDAEGRCHVKDIVVTVDPGALQALLAEMMPGEKRIRVRAAENALVLTGEVSDATVLDEVLSLATSYGDGKKVVNMLRVAGAQQVMLEVKIAEVSKSLLDRLGASVGIVRTSNGATDSLSLMSNFLSKGNALLQALRVGRTSIAVDGQKDDGLVRILAEPNIMAISGQQASFLSGGKIFIPVAQSSGGTTGPTYTLEEKQFGIGVKFIPTVLGGARINLKLVSEVSELSQTGSPFTTVGGATAVLPSLTVRSADTTVQLNDGQSFVVAGLIKNNVTEAVKRFPGLGEVPLLGALFRSTEFQNDKTELMFVITPRLVKPLEEAPVLPTENHVVAGRAGRYLNGSMEGGAAPAAKGQGKDKP